MFSILGNKLARKYYSFYFSIHYINNGVINLPNVSLPSGFVCFFFNKFPYKEKTVSYNYQQFWIFNKTMKY